MNISEEATKSGINLKDLPSLVQSIARLPNLKLRGLMAIPAPETDDEQQRAPFKTLAHTLNALNEAFPWAWTPSL